MKGANHLVLKLSITAAFISVVSSARAELLRGYSISTRGTVCAVEKNSRYSMNSRVCLHDVGGSSLEVVSVLPYVNGQPQDQKYYLVADKYDLAGSSTKVAQRVLKLEPLKVKRKDDYHVTALSVTLTAFGEEFDRNNQLIDPREEITLTAVKKGEKFPESYDAIEGKAQVKLSYDRSFDKVDFISLPRTRGGI